MKPKSIGESDNTLNSIFNVQTWTFYLFLMSKKWYFKKILHFQSIFTINFVVLLIQKGLKIDTINPRFYHFLAWNFQVKFLFSFRIQVHQVHTSKKMRMFKMQWNSCALNLDLGFPLAFNKFFSSSWSIPCLDMSLF